ncbi:MAG: tetratricopeptide repeat protein [Candidatus Omnitrophica bacterium]|nr:tetratricopeptide repeat protein [Candidatus Omnitrophota bacterium]MBU4478680.1 tetratricopeptide repeat protein [Candidatus Omnitrophota bacterium]
MKTIINIFIIGALFFSGDARAQTEADYSLMKADYDKLKSDYDVLLRDRNNLQEQAKVLLKYKGEIVTAQQQMSMVEKQRMQWELEKQSFNNQIKKLQNENTMLMDKILLLEAEQAQLQQDRDETRKSVAKAKAGTFVIDDLKFNIKELNREVALGEKKIKKKDKAMEQAEDKAARAEVTAEILRKQLDEIKEKYNKALAQNKTLEKKLERQPREYAEVARENKILLKRTALMHYNLGVFYTKNKDYPRAIAEFEKAVELNPEDSQAYFNLGYIYAEYYEDRQKAIANFQKYLRLAKKDDKDIDWVKKYILTWQTWEGKPAGK